MLSLFKYRLIMSRKVEFKDRKTNIDYLRVGLNMVGINVDYQTTELILDVVELVETKKGKADIKDTSVIEVQWEERWKNYFKELDTEK